MKWILYNALFAIAYLVMVPSFLLRMKRRGAAHARSDGLYLVRPGMMLIVR